MSETRRGGLSPRMMLLLVMAGMVLWGGYVAVGSYLYNRDPWRGLIVLACVGAFMGLWLLLMWNRNRLQRG